MWTESSLSASPQAKMACKIQRPSSTRSSDHYSTGSTTNSTDSDISEVIAQCLHDITRAYHGTWCQSYVVSDIERIIARLDSAALVKVKSIKLSCDDDRESLVIRIFRVTKEQISSFLANTLILLKKPAVRVRLSLFRTWAYCTKRPYNQQAYTDENPDDCENLLQSVQDSAVFYRSAIKTVRQELKGLAAKYESSELVTLTAKQLIDIRVAFQSADMTLASAESGGRPDTPLTGDHTRISSSPWIRHGKRHGREWKVTLTKKFSEAIEEEKEDEFGPDLMESHSEESGIKDRYSDRAHPLIIEPVTDIEQTDLFPKKSDSTETCFSRDLFDPMTTCSDPSDSLSYKKQNFAAGDASLKLFSL